MQETLVPEFDQILWHRALRFSHGANCHEMANIMSIYSTSHNLLQEYGASKEILDVFNKATNDLTNLVIKEERQNLPQLVHELKNALGWE